MHKIIPLNMRTEKLSFQLMFHLFFLIFSSKYYVCSGSDAISGHQYLSGDQTLVSREGEFELGFFKRGNSSNFFIGIWYKKISEKTIVWVANREKPVKDKYSSSLRIQHRNLVLLDESQEPIWSTNVNFTTSDPVMAVLLDDGNLVLAKESFAWSNATNSASPIWQSFDYLTDTWLPGAKLSYNKVTKKAQSLTSWKNSEDPSLGLFSLELDVSNQYIIKWNRTHQYWGSGPWNAQSKDYSLVPSLRYNNYSIFNLSFVDGANESYFTYNIIDPGVVSRLVMDASGQIMQVTWLEISKQWNIVWTEPGQKCEVYGYCGVFGLCNKNSEPFCNCLTGFEHKSKEEWDLNDFSGGCVRKRDLHCLKNNGSNKQEEDKFWVYPMMNLPETSKSLNVETAAECESICLSSCSCTAYAHDSHGCSIWDEDLLNLEQLFAGDGTGRTIHIRLAASEFSGGKNRSLTLVGAVFFLLGVVLVALLLLGISVLFVVRRDATKVGDGEGSEGSLVAFGYRSLQNATKNFSEKLGAGGFGSVFRGTLPDSTVVAVKKLESVSQGEKQFRTEVGTIGTIQHINLVRLRGFCSQGTNRLLVYEYLENRSLDKHLFHEDESNVLNWKTRCQIALGTAKGLAYLHEECREVIIHCDIKPENILLDSELCPKVADFGLAKIMGRDFSRVLTTIRGTRGYLAPEWIFGMAITVKTDVYSYGMMLFEFISGKRNSESSTDGTVRFFPSLAAQVLIDEGDILSLLDPKLDRQADLAEVLRLCKVACWCIQDEETHRPSMGQVVQILEGVLDVNLPPLPRALQTFSDDHDRVVFFTHSSSNQMKPSSDSANSNSRGS